MKPVIPLIAATAVALSLTACSSSEPQPEADTASSPVAVPSDSPGDDEKTAGEGDEPTTEEQDGAENSTSNQDSTEDQGTQTNSVTVTLDGQQTVVEPTDVYCSGSPGDIEHIIGKVDNQLPLIEVEGNSEFAMVKLHQDGPPEKSNNPKNITFAKKSATFDDATIGSASVTGTMTCTDWED